MEKVIEKENCTGCTACYSICPKNAIQMKKDKEGFLHPEIDQEKCINCGLCQKTCPVLNTKENKARNQCYLAYNKKEQEILTSSSGGIFSAIANYILNHEGIVIGAALLDQKLKHIAITKKEDLTKLKGSKYLQSDLGNSFRYIKENLKNKKILFVGTPCQVAGLKSFLKKEDENLICVDLICHGVPSSKLFEEYIKELEIRENAKLKTYNFRDKSTGWITYSNEATFENKKRFTQLAKDNDYMKLFLSDVALRESCYQCHFKLGNKYSDITLGDFWGVKEHYEKLYNDNGSSAVIINTKKGEELFHEIKEQIISYECQLEEITKGNSSLIKSAEFTKKREKFFQDFSKLDITKLSKKYSKKKRNWKARIKRLFK